MCTLVEGSRGSVNILLVPDFLGWKSTHRFVSAENWRRRTEIINYCVDVVDQSMSEKQKQLDNQDMDPAQQRKVQGALYAEEVKVGDCNAPLLGPALIAPRALDRVRCSAIRFTTSLPSRRLSGIVRWMVSDSRFVLLRRHSAD